MEGDAANVFLEVLRKSDKNVEKRECGLFLCEEIPYVGGSPDRMVQGSCCGRACLEIECPFSIRHLAPDNPESNLPYLKRENNDLILRKTHNYYTQCQIQMVAAKVTRCYFFVWTAHGNILQQIDLDQNFWLQVKSD